MSLNCSVSAGNYNITGRRGDCNGALSLWTAIQDHDVPPSSQFLSTLAALLQSHKLQVPFAVTSTEETPVQGQGLKH